MKSGRYVGRQRGILLRPFAVRGGRLLSRGLICLVETGEAFREKSRDVHLADSQLLRDLRLGEVVLEAEFENEPLTSGQALEVGLEQESTLRVGELGVFRAEVAPEGVVILARSIE